MAFKIAADLRNSFARLIEQIAFEARDDNRVDKHSGVSQRLPITVMESVVSNAERRALLTVKHRLFRASPTFMPRFLQ